MSHSGSPSRSRSQSHAGDNSHRRSRSRSKGLDKENGEGGEIEAERKRSRSRSPVSGSRSRSYSRSYDRSVSRGRSRTYSRSRSRSRGHRRNRYYSRSRSRSHSRHRSPSKSRSYSRSLSRGRRRSRSRSRSASYKSRSYSSRSRSPKYRARSRSPVPWRTKLEWLVQQRYLKSSDLDSYTMEQLEDLGDGLADNVVQRFSEVNFNRITNKSGFLMGIIRRIQQDGPDKGNGNLDVLPRSVRHRLKDLIDKGRLRKTDIDMRMCRALADLPTDVGLEAVEKFAGANLEGVRSKTGFIMGIIKRLQSDSRGHRHDRDRYDRHDRYDRR